MRTALGQMNGDDWEDYCQKLLKIKYADSDYHEVPSQFGGDLGIEGFTRSGIVFQCYSPDEDLAGRDLYEHQRDKITDDISKLIKNSDRIMELGVGLIREWQFLTPRYNSRYLISHCRTKEAEVLEASQVSIHSGFQTSLKTEDDFIPERQVLLGSAGYKFHPVEEEPPEEEVEKLLNSDNTIVFNIKTKVGRMDLDDGGKASLTRDLVRDYIAGGTELQTLNQRDPRLYSSIAQLKHSIERQIPIRAMSSRGSDSEILYNILKDYEDKLAADFSGSLVVSLISKLAMEAISDWLGRCPLRITEKVASK